MFDVWNMIKGIIWFVLIIVIVFGFAGYMVGKLF